jgi:tetratricopeptide (TPR) repeat protein
MSASPPRRARVIATAVIAALSLIAATGPAAASSADDAIKEAGALEAAGRPDEAEACLRGLLDSGVASRNPAVLLALARLTPSPEEAVALCREILESARDPRLVAEAHALRGDYLYARGSYAEAAREYEAAGGGSRNVTDAAALKRAASLLAAGDAPAAETVYRAVVEAGDASAETVPWAAVGLGRALLAQGRAEEAAEQFERTARAYADHGARREALVGAAASHEERGDTERMIAALTAVIDEYPDTYDAVLAADHLRAVAADSLTAAGEPDSIAVPPAP